MKKTDLYKSNIKYHSELNPLVWESDDNISTPVRYKLLQIAHKFLDYLDVPDFKLVDIVLRGSLTNYNYTPYSDFDLHLITDFDPLECESLARDFYDAKKKIWNDTHDIYIKGYEVELYVENISDVNKSLAAYSLLDDRWIKSPVYDPPKVDKSQVNIKAQQLISDIKNSIRDQDIEEMSRLKDKIKDMRQSGLETAGEYSIENLVFKILRNQGYIEKLLNAINHNYDKDLSLYERRKKKKRKARMAYGWPYYGYFYGSHSDISDSGDGGGVGGDGGGESLEEDIKDKVLLASLITALSLPPAAKAEVEPGDSQYSPAQKALTIWRTINRMKGYGEEGFKGEAQQEFNNILRSIQGHPNQSKIYPIIKDMMKKPPEEDSLPPLQEPTNE